MFAIWISCNCIIRLKSPKKKSSHLKTLQLRLVKKKKVVSRSFSVRQFACDADANYAKEHPVAPGALRNAEPRAQSRNKLFKRRLGKAARLSVTCPPSPRQGVKPRRQVGPRSHSGATLHKLSQIWADGWMDCLLYRHTQKSLKFPTFAQIN